MSQNFDQGHQSFGFPRYTYRYTSNQSGRNFNTQLQGIGWDGVEVAEHVIQVDAGVELTSGTQTGAFPTGTPPIIVENHGTIRGTNGSGDNGLSMGHDTISYNTDGNYWGGGGAGGSGGGGTYRPGDGETGCNPPAPCSGGASGNPGGYGDAGNPGSPGACPGPGGGCPGPSPSAGNPGGAAGKAIALNGHTHVFVGGSSSPNVEGAVS